MSSRQILEVISQWRAERLLEDWANTREDGVQRLLKIHAEDIDIPRPDLKQLARSRRQVITKPSSWTLVKRPGSTFEVPEGLSERKIAELLREAWDNGDLVEIPEGPLIEDWHMTEQIEAGTVENCVLKIAKLLRKAWEAPDQRRFDWCSWKAVDIARSVWPMFEFIEGSNQQIAATDELPERATKVEAALFHLLRIRHRALYCANPNCTTPYFFQQKKGQKFCSTLCALPSQRESKRRWWNKHKDQLKKKRRGK